MDGPVGMEDLDDGWRAPRIDELETIINYITFDPADFDPPFVTRSAFFWSSSTYAYLLAGQRVGRVLLRWGRPRGH